MSVRTFVDTNVFVYRFDSGEPAKQRRAIEVLEELASGGRLVVSTQVLQEFYVTVTRKLARHLSVEAALDAIRHLRQFSVVQIDGELIENAVLLSRDHQLSFWDSLILHAAARGGCREIWTEDLQDGFEVLGLRVVNPFAGVA